MSLREEGTRTARFLYLAWLMEVGGVFVRPRTLARNDEMMPAYKLKEPLSRL